jgi:hypothetical protein
MVMNQLLFYDVVSNCASGSDKIVIKFLWLSIAPMVEIYHMVNHRHPLSSRYPAWQHSFMQSSHRASRETHKQSNNMRDLP